MHGGEGQGEGVCAGFFSLKIAPAPLLCFKCSLVPNPLPASVGRGSFTENALNFFTVT